MRRLLVLLSAFAISAVHAQSELGEAFDQDVLIIVASTNACYRFDIYLAMTNEQRRRGLMYVRDLPSTTGMLFVYERADYHSMWMKNTYIPLDILFIRADGSISSIARDTEPLSLRSVGPAEPVNYVLELNAGVANSLAIDENSGVFWEPGNAER